MPRQKPPQMPPLSPATGSARLFLIPPGAAAPPPSESGEPVSEEEIESLLALLDLIACYQHLARAETGSIIRRLAP